MEEQEEQYVNILLGGREFTVEVGSSYLFTVQNGPGGETGQGQGSVTFGPASWFECQEALES